MRTHRANCKTRTRNVLDFVDITDAVQAELTASGIAEGQVTVFADSDACVLIVNERESGLLEDIRNAMRRLEGTGSANGKTLLGSTSVVLPAVGGKLRLGIWQRLLLVELEQPDTRGVIVQVVGE
jgi:secondary thiamine-phosphate synthase enzyme